MTLIAPVEVLAKAHVDDNMDPKGFCTHIDIAEAKLSDNDGCFGTESYDALVADLIPFVDYESTVVYALDDVVIYNGKYYKNILVSAAGTLPTVTATWQVVSKFTTADNQTLWDKHLWKILALMVQHTSTFTNSIRTTSAGEMKNNTNNSVGADFKDVKAKKDELMDNIRVLEKSMDAYLVKNKDKYPLYGGNKCAEAKCDKRPSLGVYLLRSKNRDESCQC